MVSSAICPDSKLTRRAENRSFVGHFAIFTFIALIVQLYYAAKIASLYSGKRRIILVGSVVVLALAQTGELGPSRTFSR